MVRIIVGTTPSIYYNFNVADPEDFTAAYLTIKDEAGEEVLCLGFLRVAEHLLGAALFADDPAVHDKDAGAHAGDDAEVMGDHDDRGPGLLLQSLQRPTELYWTANCICARMWTANWTWAAMSTARAAR